MSDMDDSTTRTGKLSPLKQAYLALEKTEAELAAIKCERAEPIAIIGIGCRFPGDAVTPQAFWKNLCQGHDAITEVPPDRWDIEQYYDPDPEIPGKMATRWGGFIKDVDRFDANLFGITPRETRSMDPQQRVLMEVAWEALEDAGHASLSDLEGSSTGVFVGISTDDYAQLMMEAQGLTGIDTYFASGTARSIASGRLSYQFGLVGAAVSVDTACSSSLLAVHQACRSLLDRECRMALAAGVNVMLSPATTIALSKYKMMAPDGRCKAFDAAANGFVRGEGCGVVVLKRLSDAQTDRDRIYALILGTAANQDGPSSGLTAPNGPSQEAVIRAALKRARVKPVQISFVEAHGTGTSLGDPIEVRALGECYSEGRPADCPLLIGSVKTNIGHLEAAAGIAGLIKTALVLHHRKIPPNLHFDIPNPEIPWERYPLMVPTRLMSLEAKGESLLAAVTALGFSGTNVHAVLSDAPVESVSLNIPDRPLQVLTQSGRNLEEVRQKTEGLAQWLDSAPASSLPNVAYTLNTGRTHQSHRIALVGKNPQDVKRKLDVYLNNESSAVHSGIVSDTDERPRVAFLFTGQGAQYTGMGRALEQHHPHFRTCIDECDEILRPFLGRSIRDILYPSAIGDSELINKTIFTQPALFTLEYALANLWKSWGIRPSCVLGHSLGEYVAACISGMLTLKDALKMVVLRSQLMQSVSAPGGMVAVMATEAEVMQRLDQYSGSVSIAAVNGPKHIVISGATDSIESISDLFRKDGVSVIPLKVSHAFHSSLMEPVLDQFEKSIADIRFYPPKLRLVSNVSGSVTSQEEAGNPRYWRRHARQAVRFMDGMRTLVDQGCRIFIEIGPRPVLLNMGRSCVEEEKFKWLPSIDGKSGDWERILGSLGDAYVSGISVDWEGFDRPFDRRRITLPPYPFQRRRYWFNQSSSRSSGQLPISNTPQTRSGHPLLGMRMDSATGRINFRAWAGDDQTSFFHDHLISGTASLPIAAVLEAALTAARLFWPDQLSANLKQVSMDRAIWLPVRAGAELEWVFEPCQEEGYAFQLFSRNAGQSGNEQWQQNAAGTLFSQENLEGERVGKLPSDSLDAIRRRCIRQVNVADFYSYFSRVGLDFGPAFCSLEALWCGSGEALGRLRLEQAGAEENVGFTLSPLLLDGALQVIAGALLAGNFEDWDAVKLFLPVGIDHVWLGQITDGAAWAHAMLLEGVTASSPSITCTVRLLDDQSREIAVLSGCRLVPVDAGAVNAQAESLAERMLYNVCWQARPDSKASASMIVATDGFAFPLHILSDRLGTLIPELVRVQQLDKYESTRAEMDVLISLYIMHAFGRMGWHPRPGELIQLDTLAEKLQLVFRHQQLLKRFLDILTEDGLLETVDNGWKIIRVFPEGDPSSLAREIMAHEIPETAEFDLVVRCGNRLAEALRGTVDPLDLLFRGDAFASVVKLYSESVTARIYNGLVKACVTEALKYWSPGQRLRVLEIGAGTGGTTRYVMEALVGLDVSYMFTDISPAFVQAASESFQNQPGFAAQLLDIEKDPATQGLAGSTFDLVIAANVLHATADLADTLQRVHGLMAPGGLLLLLEVTAPQRWVDITFGLTEGWWKFTDYDRRRNYPLLSAEQWKQLLAESGFQETLEFPATEGPVAHPALHLESVIVGRRDPASPPDSICLTSDASVHQNWLIMADNDGFGPMLHDRLKLRNIQPLLVVRGKAFPNEQEGAPTLSFDIREDFETLFHQLWRGGSGGGEEGVSSKRNISKIVVLWGIDHQMDTQDEISDLLASQKAILSSVLFLLQVLTEAGIKHPPQIIFVTRNAQAVTEYEQTCPDGAALWGMIRAVMLEHPELRCKLIDINAETSMNWIEPFLGECITEDPENQVAIHGETPYVPRLEPVTKRTLSDLEGDHSPEQLDITERGLFENIFWRKMDRHSPGVNQVKIDVRATGLNFRDILNTLDMYGGGPVPFGGECAGLIAETGEAVTGLKPGDKVLAIAPYSFSTDVIADSRLVWPMLDGMGFEQAAALPIAYTTAAYALQHLSDLREGQRVLIHAAAGGVGLAAVHLALQIGAQVFATAGSHQKRRYLERLGVPHVMNSRTLEFADLIMAETRGEGVDVVLNSLAGDYIERSLGVTAKGGTFIELGRSGIWTPDEVQCIRPDVTYHPVDLTEEMAQRPENIRPIFDAVIERLSSGSLPLLPCKVFTKNAVVDAFRYMARAKHIGKIVVRWPGKNFLRDKPPLARGDGTYWITGGLGALGMFTAEWLAAQGAGHIVLTGRTDPTPEAENKIAQILRSGIGLTVIAADVSSRKDVDGVLKTIRDDCPPLRGIIHAAGVLDDGVLQHQNWRRFETVLRPKIAGALNLHRATRHLRLDFMIFYSSVAGLLGSPGQANHCAASAFMDSLAHMRRSEGLPCLSINWGAWADAGAAVKEGASSRAMLTGVSRFSPETGLHLMELLIDTSQAQAAVLTVDWSQYIRHTYADGLPAPFLSGLAALGRPFSTATAPRKTPPRGLLLQLQSAPTELKKKILTTCVHQETFRILGLDPSETVDPEKPLHDLGLDSLMAVELRNALGSAIERALPATLLFDYPSINLVTDYLVRELNIESVPPPSPAAASIEAIESTDDLLSRIEAMQDDDIDRFFAQKAQDRD